MMANKALRFERGLIVSAKIPVRIRHRIFTLIQILAKCPASAHPLRMKSFLPTLFALAASAAFAHAGPVSLSDGKTFDGWEGDTTKTWRIEDGAFVGGSLNEKVPHN